MFECQLEYGHHAPQPESPEPETQNRWYRHVNKYKWSDGIWAGTIGPYDIFDLHYNYRLTENLELSVSALNFMDNQHKELIGGAQMGRQVIMRMTSNF